MGTDRQSLCSIESESEEPLLIGDEEQFSNNNNNGIQIVERIEGSSLAAYVNAT